MCGIAGWIGGKMTRVGVLRMHEAMRHRGPDGEAVWFSDDGFAALAHRRLAILSPGPSASQPMSSNGNHIVFNGEIYNHDRLRIDLARSGETFHIPGSDTEVLLKLCSLKGASALDHLEGMFAFGFYNASRRELLLARDPFGIKPLYYTCVAGGILFASELRTLLASDAIDRHINSSALAGYFLSGSVPEPETLISGIHLLPAGCFATWNEREGLKITRYWDPAAGSPSSDDPAAIVRNALRESVSRHLVSDVPVGIFLSGGIDSSAVAATTREFANLSAFSIVFDEKEFSEESRIVEVARSLGLDLHVLPLLAQDARAWFADFLKSLDQPSVDGFNTYCVSRWAASHGVKVVLSGLGGDELFGGYQTFDNVPAWQARGSRLARTGAAGRLAGALLDTGRFPPRLRRIGTWMQDPASWESSYRLFRGVYSQSETLCLLKHFGLPYGLPQEPPVAPVDDPKSMVSCLELTRYMRNQLLRDSDVMSMANGLELRVPLVDKTFYQAISAIAPSERFLPGKQLLTNAVPAIPDSVRHARKQGFTFPLNKWWSNDQWGDEPPLPKGIRPGTWARRMALIALRHWADHNRIDLPTPGKPSPHKTFTVIAPTFGNEPGGIQEFSREMVRALSRFQPSARSALVSFQGSRPDIPSLLSWADAAGPLPRGIGFLLETLRTCVNFQPDAILSTFPRFAPICLLCTKLFRIPFLTAAHGIEVWDRLPLLKRMALRHSSRILSVSRFTAEKLVHVNGAKASSIRIFPNTVDLEKFSPGAPSEELLASLAIPPGCPIILTVARLAASENSKGVETIWDAMALDERLGIHVLVGDGDDLPRLRGEAVRRKLEHRIRFLGRAASHDLPTLYRTAGVFVMTGVTEGFGIVFLEAMACGTPVVAAAAGGTADALLDGRLGWLVNPQNAREICEAIRAALQSSPDVEPRCNPNFLRQSVGDHFGYKAFQTRLATILDEVSP